MPQCRAEARAAALQSAAVAVGARRVGTDADRILLNAEVKEVKNKKLKPNSLTKRPYMTSIVIYSLLTALF